MSDYEVTLVNDNSEETPSLVMIIANQSSVYAPDHQ